MLLVYGFLAFMFGIYIHFQLIGSRYWSKKMIYHLQPVFLLGNFWRSSVTSTFADVVKSFHLANRHRKLIGCWIFSKPTLIVADHDLIKQILIRDFNQFRDRGIEFNDSDDPLSGHLFFLTGVKWRNLRVKLTPTFSSGKMKMMLPTLMECGDQLRKELEKSIGEEVEVKDLLARFSTDVIASCAFGIRTNSLENPNSEFRKYGKKIFEGGFVVLVKNLIMGIMPRMFKILKMRIVPEDVTKFFLSTVRDTIEFREQNNVSRNDFLQLLIQLMRTGKVEDVDRHTLDAAGYSDEELVFKFELNEAAAQCFIFFGAGFETSATTITFALYELALNPGIQTKLQKEIDDAFLQHDNDLTYEAVISMEYLDKVVQETLRKYPPVGILQRSCNTDYKIPELNTTIEKGTMVLFSVNGLHADPDVYPKPEVFDPERFTPESKNARHPMTYLPFGDGPRSCIGNRFALLQVKVGLISVLQAYSAEVSSGTPVPVQFDIKSFTLTPKGGLPLKIIKRVIV